MSGSLVCMRSFTAMLLRAPSESPASRASALSGATPIASSTRSASVSVLSLNCTRTPVSVSAKPETARPSRSSTPCFLRCAWRKLAMSASNWLSTCGCISTRRTSRPSSRRFSAISTPMKPPPTTTAERSFCPTTVSRMRSVSSTVRSVSIRALSMPGSFGRTGTAPGESTSLS